MAQNGLPLNVRCILQADIERDLAAGGDCWEAERNVLNSWGLPRGAYKVPLLGEVVDAGSAQNVRHAMGSTHVPDLLRVEAENLAADYGLTLPLHVEAPCSEARRTNGVVTSFVHSRKAPSDAFVKVGEGFYVATPEYTLLQRASELARGSASRNFGSEALAKMAVICSEFCGVYVVDESVPFGLLRRQALTSASECVEFLSECGHSRSAAADLFKRAIGLTCGPCASPMEIAGGVLACSPRSTGGYGLGKAEFNRALGKAKADSDRAAAKRMDIYFPAQRTALEYKGVAAHAGSLDQDAIREAQLLAENITVVTISRAQLATSEAADALMIDTLARRFRCRDMRAFEKFKPQRRRFHAVVMRELNKARHLS